MVPRCQKSCHRDIVTLFYLSVYLSDMFFLLKYKLRKGLGFVYVFSSENCV